jgi:uncharacterized Tic20 family protein
MELTLATPALLFPAVSLLFISYTSRFVTYADLVRRLHDRWQSEGSVVVERQITNLRRRITLIRNMQIAGAISLVLSVACMILLVFDYMIAAEVVFALALFWMLVSLGLLVAEITISMRALNLQLSDLETGEKNPL